MSDFGKALRLGRILKAPDHRSLVVAFDHGGVLGPIPGTRDPGAQILRFCDAGVDGVLLNPGLIRFCGEAWTRGNAPPLVIRLDWTNGISATNGASFRSAAIAHPEDALRMGADAVITYLLLGSGDPEFEAGEIERNAWAARECERAGLPLFIEALGRSSGALPGDPACLMYQTRVAAELGADAIKTEYTGQTESMRAVVEACPVPILALGGSRLSSEEETLARVGDIVRAGAAGIVYGRNVFQAPDVPAFLVKLRAALRGQPAADSLRCAVDARR